MSGTFQVVGTDYSRGGYRFCVYLPAEDLERFGIDPADLAPGRADLGRLRPLLEFQGARAYDYYTRARPLLPLVESPGRPVLRAIVGSYRGLLDAIVARDYDVLSGRISLPGWRKGLIAAGALAGLPRGGWA